MEKETLMKTKVNGIAAPPRVLVSPGAERSETARSEAERSAVLVRVDCFRVRRHSRHTISRTLYWVPPKCFSAEVPKVGEFRPAETRAATRDEVHRGVGSPDDVSADRRMRLSANPHLIPAQLPYHALD